MHSYLHSPGQPRIMQVPDVEQTYDTWDQSLPTDQPFFTRIAQFQFPFSPMEARIHQPPYSQQQWKADTSCSVQNRSTETQSYGYRVSPWNIGLSNTSEPQSPRCSNNSSVPTIKYHASPQPQDDDSTFATDPSVYFTPGNLNNIEPSLLVPDPRVCEVQASRQPPLEGLGQWPSSNSKCNPTAETRWSPPIHQGSMALASRSRPRALSTSRVRKSTENRTRSTPGRRRRRALSGVSNDEELRPFVCSFAPYGCESKFVSKNEWKRHVTSQHLLLGFYYCDVGNCNPQVDTPSSSSGSPRSYPTLAPSQANKFNRKDLFTQHQRRMHAPWLQSKQRRTPTDSEHAAFESSLEEVRQRCWQSIRQPPTQSHCGFCGDVFSGSNSWDVRMEHVGRHFERTEPACLAEEAEDVALRDWGLREGILAVVNGRCRLASLVGAMN
jgi:hypothetical protein